MVWHLGGAELVDERLAANQHQLPRQGRLQQRPLRAAVLAGRLRASIPFSLTGPTLVNCTTLCSKRRQRQQDLKSEPHLSASACPASPGAGFLRK